jgi:hypothetical protein
VPGPRGPEPQPSASAEPVRTDARAGRRDASLPLGQHLGNLGEWPSARSELPGVALLEDDEALAPRDDRRQKEQAGAQRAKAAERRAPGQRTLILQLLEPVPGGVLELGEPEVLRELGQPEGVAGGTDREDRYRQTGEGERREQGQRDDSSERAQEEDQPTSPSSTTSSIVISKGPRRSARPAREAARATRERTRSARGWSGTTRVTR